MKLKEWILNLTTAVTGLCAVAVTVHAYLPAKQSPVLATAVKQLQPQQWRPLLVSGHRIGPLDAKLTVVEFGDFQCPACGAYEHVLDSMRVRYPNSFAVVFHQFPLAYHPLAYPLARAAECAAAQGRFVAFHDSVYQDQARLGIVPITELGTEIGVADTVGFKSCAAGTAKVSTIESDVATGKQLGVPGTPALIVGGRMYGPTLGFAQLDSLMRAALKAGTS